MKASTVCRILRCYSLKRGLRENYYAAHKFLGRVCSLLKSQNRIYLRKAAIDCFRYLFDCTQPLEGKTREGAEAAAAWILKAQEATPDGGVSHGFFPLEKPNAWKPSYPEITGYIIPSLLQYAERHRQPDARHAALVMASWLLEIQLESGAVQAGVISSSSESSPAIFNTGMVLYGWTAAFRASGEGRFLEAAKRAADFMIADLRDDGYFETHGPCVTYHPIKTYNCLCAWGLLRLGQDLKNERYKQAALKIVDAALLQQQSNGWFANNCLSHPEAPLVHTIAYTLQGILEVGILTERAHFIRAVELGTVPLLDRMRANGFLHGRYFSDWEPACFSSCLTGSAQIAVVCYRLAEITGSGIYLDSANRLVNFLKAVQEMNTPDSNAIGAIAGSFPLLGGYMPGGYPSWATKFLLDSLLLQDAQAKTNIQPLPFHNFGTERADHNSPTRLGSFPGSYR